MANFIPLLFIALIACSKTENQIRIPLTWEKDFSIQLSEGGGMANQSTTIIYNYDSIVYTIQVQNIDSTRSFALSTEDRDVILNKLKSLHLEKIKSLELDHAIPDKETTRICLISAASSICLSQGSSSDIIDPEKSFAAAWMYLEEMAKKRLATH